MTSSAPSSKNVLALLPGRERPGEYIVYMAHWDHLGRGPDTMDDPIFNGAFDNATGTAGLVELARAFAALPERPARSVAFLAVTAEEQGLLGSAYYAANPVYPTASTVAAINMDGLNADGPMNDITVVGMGNSELDDYLAEAAVQGRAHPAARSRTREGLLLPVRPLQLREGGHPFAVHRLGHRPRRTRHRMDAGPARRLHQQPLPQGRPTSSTRHGISPGRSTTSACSSGWATGWPTPTTGRTGGKTTSFER